MNKFSHPLTKTIILVLLWLGLLSLVLRFTLTQPPDIQFPYYHSDLLAHYSRADSVLAHFDGIHYLRIARYGYQDMGTQAFFPLYPILIRTLTPIFSSPLLAAIFISIASLIIAIIGLRRLFPTSLYTIPYLLIFPTSFYLIAAYSESLFLALAVWFFIMLKRKKWLLAAVLAGLASGTRVFGGILAASLLLEYLRTPGHKLSLLPVYILISLSGLISYQFFLYREFLDPLLFLHVQPMFGAERSGSSLILLPQVLYRYFRMLLTVEPSSWVFQRLFLELTSFLAFLVVSVKRVLHALTPMSLYVILALILPTLTGTLSSLPRYLLIILPFALPDSYSPRLRFFAPISLLLLAYLFSQFALGRFVA